MIITEDTPESPQKLAQNQLPSGPGTNLPVSQAPPAYPGYSGSTPSNQHIYQPYPDRHYLFSSTLPLNGTRNSEESAKKRFFKALFIAIVINVIFSLVLRSFIILMVTLTEEDVSRFHFFGFSSL
jgi:hypothetical protein